jgi:hypothetical protein
MKYIELIDKYIIQQSPDDKDYNPPNYIWTDNTGELIRCEDCKYSDWYETKSGEQLAFCTYHDVGGFKPDSYCSFAESADMRKGEGEKE